MRVDLSNTLEERVGDHGLSDDDLDELDESLSEVHETLQRGREEGKFGYAFADLPRHVDIEEIQRVADDLRDDFGFLVNIGVGGSALGGAALTNSLRPDSNVYFPDNLDPDLIGEVLNSVSLENTVFNVVSKSGSTAETAANFLVMRDELEKEGLDWRDHVVVTTGTDGILRDLVEREDLRSFEVPEDVPGRFSALSPVGLFSAAFAGADIERIVEGALGARERCSEESVYDNPGYALGGVSYLLDTRGDKTMSVMMPYSERLFSFVEWYAQLWAESLGKRREDGSEVNVGQSPVKSMGITDQHSQLQLFVDGPNNKLINLVRVKESDYEFEIPGVDGSSEGDDYLDDYSYLSGHSLSDLMDVELSAIEAALVESNRPNLSVELDSVNEFCMGELLYTYETAVVAAAELYGVDAFDQPGVELGKKATYSLLDRDGYDGYDGYVRNIDETLFEV
ncbi:glucose-6-phosphate isomerase [Halorutilales archaeon Cl-col2-1]